MLDSSSPEMETNISFILKPDCCSISFKHFEIEEAVVDIFIIEPFLTPEVSILEKA